MKILWLILLLMASLSAKAASHQEYLKLPERPADALSGSEFIKKMASLSGYKLENAIVKEILKGNVPQFLRQMKAIETRMSSGPLKGKIVRYWTMPDYLAVGSNEDYIRVPLNLHSIARISNKLDLSLPTVKMVNQIYDRATVKFSPQPIAWKANIMDTLNILKHNDMVANQALRVRYQPGLLSAGQKKDIVQSRRLIKKPGAIAIYGWHRNSANPIQPLSTVHSAEYADYSHGVRLVSNRVEIDDRQLDLRDALENKRYAALFSNEGVIPQKPRAVPRSILASVSRHN